MSDSGEVTAVAEGEATITARAGDKSAVCKLTVAAPAPAEVAVSSITLDATTLNLKIGDIVTLYATVLPKNATDKTVRWSSSDSKIATVSDEGDVEAIAEGTATITAQAGEKSATCKVSVATNVVSVTSVTLDKTTLNLKPGYSEDITATVKPDNATDKTLTWTSSNPEVATVYGFGMCSGTVTALAPGEAIITAEAGGKTATCKVTVPRRTDGVAIRDKYQNPDPDYFENEALHLTEGDVYYLKNLAFDVNYDADEPVPFDCISEDESIVRASRITGTVEGVKIEAKRPFIVGGVVKPVRVWVAVRETPSIRDYVDVYVHSKPDDIEIDGSNSFAVLKPGTSQTFAFSIKPSTAKQRLQIRDIPKNKDGYGTWRAELLSGLRLKVTAPAWQNNYKEDLFFGPMYSMVVQTTSPDPTNRRGHAIYFYLNMWDENDIKPMDYVYYNSSTGKLRSSDGGLRALYQSNGSIQMRYASVSPSPQSNETAVALITYLGDIPDKAAKANDSYWGKNVMCGLSNSSNTHGFAVAVSNAKLDGSAIMSWSEDKDDVDASSNWPGDGYTTQVSSSASSVEWRNAYGLTRSSAYYNYKRGNSHDIKPMKALLEYAKAHPVGNVGLGSRTDLDGFNTRWVLPTIYMNTVSGWNGTTLRFTMYDKDDPFFIQLYYNAYKCTSQGYELNSAGVWSINTRNKNEAWLVRAIPVSKTVVADFVPWLIF